MKGNSFCALCVFFLFICSSLSSHAGGYRYMRYPLKSNLFGFMGGVFLTSNPDMSGYNVKKNYVDGGGGMVYDYRNEVSENYSFEMISSLMISSCSTSTTEDGENKLKVIFPLEARWYIGSKDFKVFVGAGLQYNFIWTLKDEDNGGSYYYYGESSIDSEASAHQLSANGSIGFSILGMNFPVHLLLGAKFHFPLVNNAEGVEYSQSKRVDFSKDKTCVTATGGLSFDLGRSCVMMLNYDYPLGGNKQTEVDGNYFQMHSQSITMSFMFRL